MQFEVQVISCRSLSVNSRRRGYGCAVCWMAASHLEARCRLSLGHGMRNKWHCAPVADVSRCFGRGRRGRPNNSLQTDQTARTPERSDRYVGRWVAEPGSRRRKNQPENLETSCRLGQTSVDTASQSFSISRHAGDIVRRPRPLCEAPYFCWRARRGGCLLCGRVGRRRGR